MPHTLCPDARSTRQGKGLQTHIPSLSPKGQSWFRSEDTKGGVQVVEEGPQDPALETKLLTCRKSLPWVSYPLSRYHCRSSLLTFSLYNFPSILAWTSGLGTDPPDRGAEVRRKTVADS